MKASSPKTEPKNPKGAPAPSDPTNCVPTETVPTRCLECPPELPPVARQEWDRIVGELIALGVLSKFDRGPLAVYCGAYAIWTEAMEAIQKYGTMIKSPTGYPVQSPYVAIVNRQAEMMMRIAGEFGFTPAARSRSFSYSKSESMLLDVEGDTKEDPTEW
jgi:P27 family predicted phage terminase small subunit